jgi:hypothetical protein
MTTETPLLSDAFCSHVFNIHSATFGLGAPVHEYSCATAFRTHILSASSEIFLPRNVRTRSSYYTVCHNTEHDNIEMSHSY